MHSKMNVPKKSKRLIIWNRGSSTYWLLMDAWYAPTYEKEQDHITVNDTKYLPSSTDISQITLLGKG